MITIQQNKQLHALLTQTGLMGQKANLVEGLTKGRTDKSSELNNVEANELIRYLRSQLPPMRHDGQKVKAKDISSIQEDEQKFMSHDKWLQMNQRHPSIYPDNIQ